MLTDLQKLVEEYPPKRSTSNVRIKYPDAYSRLVEVTSFLPDNVTTSRRLWHVRNDNYSIPTCDNKNCDNPVNWFNKYCDYAEFCSIKCFNSNKTHVAEVNNHKHNVSMYGENYKDLSRLDKSKITNLRKYGVDNPFKDVEKIKKSNRGKFGTNFHFQQHLSDDSLDKLNDLEWLQKMNHKENRTCTEIADLLGVNNTTVNKAMYRLGLTPSHNYSGSYLQQKIANTLAEYVEIKENDRELINPFELDIVIPEKKLAIEYCGLYWHNELHKDMHYHRCKLDFCNELGYRLVTIFEDEFLNRENIVLGTLKYLIGVNHTSRIHTRKCTIVEIDSQTKKNFFNDTHIQGDGPSSINIALFYEGKLVACAGFKKDGKNVILNRFSTSVRLPGALSKIISYLEKHYDFSAIITFADLRWSSGTLYERTGFKKDKMLSPDYSYVYKNERFHKFNFRHEKLKKILPNYNPEYSEHENCLNHKIYRIYDCGKARYIYHLKK